jgi:hypothetical protein
VFEILFDWIRDGRRHARQRREPFTAAVEDLVDAIVLCRAPEAAAGP